MAPQEGERWTRIGRLARAIRVAGYGAAPESVQARWAKRFSDELGQAIAEGFKDTPDVIRYRGTYAGIAEPTRSTLTAFAPEVGSDLETNQGRVVLTLSGMSIDDLAASGRQNANRKFSSTWHNNDPLFRQTRANPTEVAVNLDSESFFFEGSEGLTIEQAEALIAEKNEALVAAGNTSVKHLFVKKPSLLAELAFMLEELEGVQPLRETAALTGYRSVFDAGIYVVRPEEGVFLGYRSSERWKVMVPDILVPAGYKE